jgi:hypothetical protein
MNINKIQEVIELGLKPNGSFYSSLERAEILSDLFETELEKFQGWLNTKHYETKGYNDKDFAQWYNKEINKL